MAMYCGQHAEIGMVNVRDKQCNQEGCSIKSTFGVQPSKAPVYYGQHAKDGKVNVVTRRPAHVGCKKQSTDVEDIMVAVHHRQYAEDVMVDVIDTPSPGGTVNNDTDPSRAGRGVVAQESTCA